MHHNPYMNGPLVYIHVLLQFMRLVYKRVLYRVPGLYEAFFEGYETLEQGIRITRSAELCSVAIAMPHVAFLSSLYGSQC